MIVEALFWLAVALLVYTLALFPIVVFARGILFPRSYQSSASTPAVSLIVAAHNEAKNIGQRLENLLSLDYPPDRLEILIASDGSTDETESIVARYAERGIQLLALPRRGKIPTLNAAAAAAGGEILVFTDANTEFEASAVRALVRPFADSQIGGVAGNQVYSKEEGATLTADGECAYWDFDRSLKMAQSRAGSVTSATGAIYAIRRSLFRPIPVGVTDDFVASTNVIAEGYRLVFAADAICTEPVASETKTEFGRKVRVITQGFLAVLVMRSLFNPFRHGFYSLQLFWHKVLRRLTVFPALLLLVTSVLLWNHGLFFQAIAVGQFSFYGCAVLGLLLRETRLGRFKGLTIPFYFCMVNAAALMAVFKSLRGQKVELWEPQRPAGNPEMVTGCHTAGSGADSR